MLNYSDSWQGSLLPGNYKEMDRYFEEWMNRRDSGTQTLRPKGEASEDKGHYYFKLDLPGISKDQIKIEFQDQTLTISGERKQEKSEESKKQHVSELNYGSFIKSYTLPGAVHSEGIQANYEYGVLQVSVPKSELTKSKQIQIR